MTAMPDFGGGSDEFDDRGVSDMVRWSPTREEKWVVETGDGNATRS